MNFLGSAAFSVVASLIYKYKKTLVGGIIGLGAAIFSMTAMMLLANIVVTPYFMKTSTETVIKMIPTILLPFNFLKALANAGLVIGFYKPISNALKAVGAIRRREDEKLKFDKITVILLVIAVLISAVSIAIMFSVLT
jgi:riboflavin transporter FmnP